MAEDVKSECAMLLTGIAEAAALSCSHKVADAIGVGYSQTNWWTSEMKGAIKLVKESYKAWLACGSSEAAESLANNVCLIQSRRRKLRCEWR